ncbi:ArsR/SmtB family transcription factor [Niveispirillum fermenti]|uniref:ArsR/SmtB family transcription factor n=1 Tax=Niveispirillum fermenti TaxID=1233113 RepID=UPI003A865BDB
MNAPVLPVKTTDAAALLKAMGNERRLCVLLHLAEGEKAVGELETLVGLSQSALSQHLALLRLEGMVQTRRQAQTIFYSLRGEAVTAVLSLLARIYPVDADPMADDGHAAPAPIRRPAAAAGMGRP